MGILWAVAALGELVGLAIFGALADPSEGYYLPVLIFCGCYIIGSVLCLCIGPLRAIRKYDRERIERLLVIETSDSTPTHD